MATPLNLTTGRDDDGTQVLVITGELDLSNVSIFAEGLASAASAGGMVTVDLSAVDYLDSAAINALFTHTDSIRIFANPLLLPVLTVTGLTELVSVQPRRSGTEPEGHPAGDCVD